MEMRQRRCHPHRAEPKRRVRSLAVRSTIMVGVHRLRKRTLRKRLSQNENTLRRASCSAIAALPMYRLSLLLLPLRSRDALISWVVVAASLPATASTDFLLGPPQFSAGIVAPAPRHVHVRAFGLLLPADRSCDGGLRPLPLRLSTMVMTRPRCPLSNSYQTLPRMEASSMRSRASSGTVCAPESST